MADSKKPLRKLRKKQNQALDKYSEAVRGDLSRLDRLKLKAIIVIEIHARDVIEKMYKMSKSNFIRMLYLYFYNHSSFNICSPHFCFANVYSMYTRMEPTNYGLYRTMRRNRITSWHYIVGNMMRHSEETPARSLS